MNKDYTKYTTEKLLEDDFFIESNTSPTLDTINFWKGQIADGLMRNAPLTFKDVETVKNVFVEKLKIMYHTRISYPDLKK